MALNDLLSGMKGNYALNGALGSKAGGALVSAFATRRSARILLNTGGLMAVGRLAWQAYNRYRSGQRQGGALSPAEIPRQQFEAVLDARSEKPGSGLVLQALIAAAHADRHLSEREQTRIWKCAMDLGATGSELAALTETMANPPSMDDLATGAETLEQRIQMYLAASMVIDEQREQGHKYLRQFASRLRLPLPLVEVLDERSNAEPVAA